MPKVTLSMIVKNEEKYLRGCLDSVKGIADEIVLVDTGSTDSTIDIAKEYGAKIFHYKWIKDFSAARNYALSKSTGDWILYLDADERIEKKSKNELFKKIKGNKNLAINCIINNIDDIKDSSSKMKYVRLFRNNENIYFEGKAHEQIEPSLAKQKYSLIDSTIEITHLGYNVSKDALQIKAKRNLEMLLADYEENPTAYTAYQISSSYSILNERDTAVNYARKALEDNNLRKELRSVCYLHIADYDLNTGNLLSAKEMIDKGLTEDKNHSLLNLLASQIYNKLNENEKAIYFCKNSLLQNSKVKSSKNSKNALDIVIDESKIIYQGILVALSYEDKKELNFFLNELGKVSPNEHNLLVKILENDLLDEKDVFSFIQIIDTSGLEILLKIIKNNNNAEFKLDFYSNIYDRFNNNLEYLTNFGEFLISINQLPEAEIILNTTFDVSPHNYAAIFYLASIYIQTQEFNKLNDLLSAAENRIGLNSPHYSKLCLLKEKVAPLFIL